MWLEFKMADVLMHKRVRSENTICVNSRNAACPGLGSVVQQNQLKGGTNHVGKYPCLSICYTVQHVQIHGKYPSSNTILGFAVELVILFGRVFQFVLVFI